ncbi:hypothetical protein [Hymenobacter sp. YC55]|uniref:hypothetical protein n=1 Tax=Hymenobacter sp. YC55 TaxID=3034019 RepID=UPI0023F9A9A0|nr:hypothetical protein [Hymenobacter sp. YC55]MDF7810503.1 hypothetical protein [Hymenobacter sp. YC55]
MSAEINVKQLKFNRPQLRFIITLISSAISIWGRATGKSSLIAWLMHLIVQQLPRSAWALCGQTYQQILTRTLPSTIASLERIGYFQGVHYVIGVKPPAHFALPFEPPQTFNHCMVFYTGACFHLVSLDGGGGSARGLNLDGIISDESLTLNKEKFDDEVVPANRGNERQAWSDNRLHHGIFHFSSMPYGQQGKWLLEGSKHYQEAGKDYEILTRELIKLQLKYIDNKDREARRVIWGDIQKLTTELRYYVDKDGQLYSEANAFENMHNVGIRYFEQQRRVLTDFTFRVEMLNQRPFAVEAGFYPTLDTAKHAYEAFNNDYLGGIEFNLKKLQRLNDKPDSRQDGDCDPTLPLRIAPDWGKASFITIAQVHAKQREYRFLKGLYVKHPELIRHLAAKFTEYYAYHLIKRVEFIEDAEYGNSRVPNSDETYNQMFVRMLREAEWKVKVIKLGRTPGHHARYLLAHELLAEQDPRNPIIRFNKHHCKEVLLAMQLTEMKEGPKGIEKNKKTEKLKSVPAEEAPHFTDTVDLHLLSIDDTTLKPAADFSGFIMEVG